MNETILDICIKAGINTWPFNEVGFISLDESELVKFAELIVRECLEQGSILSKHYIDTHPEQEQVILLASIADYSSEIKQHFEIES